MAVKENSTMKQDIITTIIVAIFASTGFWTFLQTWMSNKNRKQSSEQKLILGLAFIQIVAKCEFYILRGWIDADEYKELNHYLFEPYQQMGGNGTAARLIKEVEKLPIRKEGELQ